MIRRLFHLAFSGLLIVFTFTFIAVTLLIAGIDVVAAAIFPGLRPSDRHLLAQPPEADEFDFEHAIEAYDDLLGAHMGRMR
jgi:hypothetical protein